MDERSGGLIQRAAERLRAAQRSAAAAPSAPPPAAEMAPPTIVPPHREPVPDPDEADGQHTRREVKIDRQRLAKAGITFSVTERSRIAEEFRIILRQILAKAESIEAGPSRLIMVTSARPREGKTFTAIHLALAIASQRDFRVLAMDCDVDRQSLTSILGIDADTGLFDVLEKESLDMRDILLHTDIPNLTVLPAGRRRHGVPELMSSRRMRDVLSEMAHRYSDRYIIVDAPPCLATSDPSILASMVGQIVFVVEANRTQEPEIDESLRLISTCPNISLILNKTEGASSDYFGSYGYY
ncbi:MAG TPA: AAA family ATPase [Stellaceae bacterium]|nr:AAA family ATPase [Stellaceae bacterium]